MNSETTLTIGETAASQPEISAQLPVFFFDFAPVLERSPALRRNPERIQLMCEHCVRRLAPADLLLMQPSGFFLVVHSSTGSAAEALAHEINIALQELFFGTDATANLGTICRKATLTEIEGRGISLQQETPAATAPVQKVTVASQLELVETDPLARLAEGGVPGYDGLSTGFLPMINLRKDTPSIYMCGAVRKQDDKTLFGSPALTHLDPRDRASIDEAMLDYALGFARAMVPTSNAAAIATSVHYETLAWSRGRQLYQKALRNAAAANKNPFLLVQIEGVPPGTPAARIAEIVSMVRPFVRRVFLELPEWEPGLMRGGLMGVAGIVTALPAGDLAAAGRALSGLVQLAKAQQAVACVTNAAGPNQIAMARAAGVRFAASQICRGSVFAGCPALDNDCSLMARAA